jgi:hypothetical protein
MVDPKKPAVVIPEPPQDWLLEELKELLEDKEVYRP